MSSWGCKGSKGKDKGKSCGKGKGKSAPGHTLPRTRLSAEKFTGTCVDWKGKYGWIQPSEEIAHEKAGLRGGRLFAGMDDIIGGQALEPGAEVEFHICEDESGLGAEEIVQTGFGKPHAAAGKGFGAAAKGGAAWGAGGGAKGKAWGAPGSAAKGGWQQQPAKGGWGAPQPVAAKGKGGGWGAAPCGGKGVIGSFGKGGKDNKGFGKGKDGKDGKGKSKSKEGGKGHLLERTRITAEKFTGTVAAWKGKYGWITPSEEIAHEKAALHKGSLFVGINDLIGVTELTPGSMVEFHINEDASGLGAEEVVQY